MKQFDVLMTNDAIWKSLGICAKFCPSVYPSNSPPNWFNCIQQLIIPRFFQNSRYGGKPAGNRRGDDAIDHIKYSFNNSEAETTDSERNDQDGQENGMQHHVRYRSATSNYATFQDSQCRPRDHADVGSNCDQWAHSGRSFGDDVRHEADFLNWNTWSSVELFIYS